MEVFGILADDMPRPSRFEGRGVEFLGSLDKVTALPAHVAYVLAVGYPLARRTVAAKAAVGERTAATLIHPTTSIGHGASIGAGSVGMPFARVSAGAGIGEHVSLGYHSAVGHDTVIGDFVSIMPGAMISGDVTVGASVVVGTNATVVEGVTIGERALIAAGGVVTRDVPANGRVSPRRV